MYFLVLKHKDEEILALAVELKTMLGLANAEAHKLAQVVVEDFGVISWAKFKIMDTTDKGEAIRTAHLKKASLKSIISVTSNNFFLMFFCFSSFE